MAIVLTSMLARPTRATPTQPAQISLLLLWATRVAGIALATPALQGQASLTAVLTSMLARPTRATPTPSAQIALLLLWATRVAGHALATPAFLDRVKRAMQYYALSTSML